MKKKIFITLLLMVFSIISVFIFASCNDTNIESIEISGMPTKLSYYTGEELNYDGIQVKIEYKDKKLSDIISSDLITVVAPDMTSLGEKVVTVKYNEKNKEYSTSYTITVKDHTYSNTWSSDDETHWHSCLDEGYYSLKGDEALNDYDDGEVITQATDYQSGEIKYICKICGHEKTEIIPQKATVYYSADNSQLFLRDDNTFSIRNVEYDDYSNEKDVYEENGNIKKTEECIELKTDSILSSKYKYNKKIDASEKNNIKDTAYKLLNLSPNIIAIANINEGLYFGVHIYTDKKEESKDFLTVLTGCDFGLNYDLMYYNDGENEGDYAGNLYCVYKNGSFEKIEIDSYQRSDKREYQIIDNNIKKEKDSIYELKITYKNLLNNYPLKFKVYNSDKDNEERKYEFRVVNGETKFAVKKVPDRNTILSKIEIYNDGGFFYLNDEKVTILEYPKSMDAIGKYSIKYSYNNLESEVVITVYDPDAVSDVFISLNYDCVVKGTSKEDAFNVCIKNLGYENIEGKTITISGYDPNKLGLQCIKASCENVESEEEYIFIYDDSNKKTIKKCIGIYKDNDIESNYSDRIKIGENYDNYYINIEYVDGSYEFIKFDINNMIADKFLATDTVSIRGYYPIIEEYGSIFYFMLRVGNTDSRLLYFSSLKGGIS